MGLFWSEVRHGLDLGVGVGLYLLRCLVILQSSQFFDIQSFFQSFLHVLPE